MYRLKEVQHVDTIIRGARTRTKFDYESDQTWVPTGNPGKFFVATAENVGYGVVDFAAQDETFDGISRAIEGFAEGGSNCPLRLTRSLSIPTRPRQIDERHLRSDGASQTVETNCNTSSPRFELSPTIALQQQSSGQCQESPARYIEPVSVSDDDPQPETNASAGVEDLCVLASPSELPQRRRDYRFDTLVESSVEPEPLEMDDRIVEVDTDCNALPPARQILTRLPRNPNVLLPCRKADLLQYFVQKLAPWVCRIAEYRDWVKLLGLILLSARPLQLVVRIRSRNPETIDPPSHAALCRTRRRFHTPDPEDQLSGNGGALLLRPVSDIDRPSSLEVTLNT